jgi:hypothetical protein
MGVRPRARARSEERKARSGKHKRSLMPCHPITQKPPPIVQDPR